MFRTPLAVALVAFCAQAREIDDYRRDSPPPSYVPKVIKKESAYDLPTRRRSRPQSSHGYGRPVKPRPAPQYFYPVNDYEEPSKPSYDEKPDKKKLVVVRRKRPAINLKNDYNSKSVVEAESFRDYIKPTKPKSTPRRSYKPRGYDPKPKYGSLYQRDSYQPDYGRQSYGY